MSPQMDWPEKEEVLGSLCVWIRDHGDIFDITMNPSFGRLEMNISLPVFYADKNYFESPFVEFVNFLDRVPSKHLQWVNDKITATWSPKLSQALSLIEGEILGMPMVMSAFSVRKIQSIIKGADNADAFEGNGFYWERLAINFGLNPSYLKSLPFQGGMGSLYADEGD